MLFAAFFKQGETQKKRWLLGTIILFLFFSNAFIFDEIARKWEIPIIKNSQLSETYDAGIVLGGISAFDTVNDRLQFYAAADRLFQAIKLYKTGKIKKIFFVGGSGSLLDANLKEAVFVHDYLITLGIPDTAILIESESKNTRENAINSKPILNKNFTKGKYLLITSAMHMRRALACFNKAGITANPYSTDSMSGSRKFVFDYLLIPDAHPLLAWNALIHEWIGYITYKISGYI